MYVNRSRGCENRAIPLTIFVGVFDRLCKIRTSILSVRRVEIRNNVERDIFIWVQKYLLTNILYVTFNLILFLFYAVLWLGEIGKIPRLWIT